MRTAVRASVGSNVPTTSNRRWARNGNDQLLRVDTDRMDGHTLPPAHQPEKYRRRGPCCIDSVRSVYPATMAVVATLVGGLCRHDGQNVLETRPPAAAANLAATHSVDGRALARAAEMVNVLRSAPAHGLNASTYS